MKPAGSASLKKRALVARELEPFGPVDRSLHLCATKQFSPAALSVWQACLASAGDGAAGAQPDPARERHDQLAHAADGREARR